MKFEHDGKTFRIEFQRDRRKLHRPGVPATSTYPYTTARLLSADPTTKAIEVYAHGTVGCWHKEKKFTIEQGRLQALRKLTEKLPKELRSLLWQTYRNRRPNSKPEGATPSTVDGEVLQ